MIDRLSSRGASRTLLGPAAVVVLITISASACSTGGEASGAPASSGPSPSPSVRPSLSASAGPSPSPSASIGVLPAGSLAVGRHEATYLGVTFSFVVPTVGWERDASYEGMIYKWADGAHNWIGFWSPDNVYADPCGQVPLDPAPGPSAAELADAVASIPGTDATGPSDVSVGGLPAKFVALTVKPGADCDPPAFYLWYEDVDGAQDARWANSSGSTERVWIADVDGTRFFIDTEQDAPGAEIEQDIQQIVSSIVFARP